MPSLLRGFAESVQRYPKRPALYLPQKRWTYQDLAAFAGSLASTITDNGLTQKKLIGLFSSGSLTSYIGPLAILSTGRGFVPIDPHHPPKRSFAILEDSQVDTLVVGPKALDRLETLLAQQGRPLSIIAPEVDDLRGLAARHPRHRFTTAPDLARRCQDLIVPETTDKDPAYLLFTSGSTGSPRGVVVNQKNIDAYLQNAARRFPLTPHDRCTHTFPMTFDLSVHDLFTTWSAGAALIPWLPAHHSNPAPFIRHHQITRWFSVPTVAMTMERLDQLTPEAFPSLRSSLFCGEPLPATVAQAWARAAPNSSIFNLYGPTEATVAISSYRFAPHSISECRRGVVPLGEIFDDQSMLVVGESGHPVGPGGQGELLLSGSQITRSYFRDRQASVERFIFLPSQGEGLWFCTGDFVEVDEKGQLHFVGRVDDQIQLRGHRVELAEIDHALRLACGHQMATAVPWPRDPSGVYGLVAFVACDKPIDQRHLLARCRRHLPNAMVPDRIIGLSELPQNERGKIDRLAMQRFLENKEQ